VLRLPLVHARSLASGDALPIALAERTGAEIVITLDRRHFTAVQPRRREAFQLLPYPALLSRVRSRPGRATSQSVGPYPFSGFPYLAA
jgi:hypothetical protein